MKIEVACTPNRSNKAKGDLLENLSKKLLESQSYDVIDEIRIAGAELDLLCKHRVNNREIYVECKAHKDTISASVLRQLWGTVDSEEYSEGWIISTSEFTKDAKGFIEKWKSKDKDKSSRLSFYSPTQIIESLKASSMISNIPTVDAEKFIGGKEYLGEWILLISEFGIFWCVYTLNGGAPSGVLVFHSINGKQVKDIATLNNLSKLETTLSEYDLTIGSGNLASTSSNMISELPLVVEVQTGESWNDYRPARPKDFVGRDSTQKDIFDFINITKNRDGSRVFAITGNSGLGKSSLIAKIRDRARNKFHKNKYFIYAVDIRGARSPLYILASLMACFQEAQKHNFGKNISLNLTDPSAPLNSDSVRTFLKAIEEKEQVICLIFDQFEELYSKPELFGIFKAAKDLMIDIAGSKANIVLGFAWKTDSTTHQDHPAYHMWHELADLRREFKLEVFDKGEISKSITTFEKEINQKISIGLRHQITHSSQGFPWLLKKLCINLYEGFNRGDNSESLLVDLDAGKLFDSDIETLSPSELTCLKIIAANAPADWSEIIELSSVTVLNALVHKRLVVKSGDRINIYWDTFKDYLLSGKTPVIPFNYIPSTDATSMLNICSLLTQDKYFSSLELAELTKLKERTIWNIGADLVMFGLAERSSTSFKLHHSLVEYSEGNALMMFRDKLSKHALKLSLYNKYASKTIDRNIIKSELICCIKNEKYTDKTWDAYTNRLIKFLMYTGFLVQSGRKYIVQDLGSPITDRVSLAIRGKQRGKVFSISVSPFAVCEAIHHLIESESPKELKRNVLSVLKRFELAKSVDGLVILNEQSINKYGGVNEAVWTLSKNEPSLAKCVEILNNTPDISGVILAESISNEYDLTWSMGSKIRNGGILKQWSSWIKEGIEFSIIPPPPGRPNKALQGKIGDRP